MSNKTLLSHAENCLHLLTSVLFYPLILSSLLFSNNSAATSLNVAVASNFIAPIQQLAADFERETGIKLQLSFGSSGKLFAQITHYAPYDIFLSADQTKPDRLILNKLALAESRIIYARGQLALWSATSLGTGKLQDILQNAHRIAIANPKLAPYGEAAKQTMVQLKVWNEIKSRVVQGENIGQTYQFVYSHNADLGFVAYSQVLAGLDKGEAILIPPALYNSIDQAGVILSRSTNTTQAQAFMAFLMRPDIQTKIAEFGYATP